MDGAKQWSITPGPSRSGRGRGRVRGRGRGRGPGRPRKDQGEPAVNSVKSEEEENSGDPQESQFLHPSPDDNILQLKCFGCGKFYSTKSSLSSHKYLCKRRKLHQQKRKFQCTTCCKHYASKQYLKIHRQQCRGDTMDSENMQAIPSSSTNFPTGRRRGKKISSRAVSARVKKVPQKYDKFQISMGPDSIFKISDSDDDSHDDVQAKGEDRKPPTKKHKCNDCGHILGSQQSLATHMWRHRKKIKAERQGDSSERQGDSSERQGDSSEGQGNSAERQDNSDKAERQGESSSSALNQEHLQPRSNSTSPTLNHENPQSERQGDSKCRNLNQDHLQVEREADLKSPSLSQENPQLKEEGVSTYLPLHNDHPQAERQSNFMSPPLNHEHPLPFENLDHCPPLGNDLQSLDQIKIQPLPSLPNGLNDVQDNTQIDLQAQKMEAESPIGCVQILTEKSNAPVDEMTLEDMDISNTKPHEEDFQLDITEQEKKMLLLKTPINIDAKLALRLPSLVSDEHRVDILFGRWAWIKVEKEVDISKTLANCPTEDFQNRNLQDELTYNNQLRESDGANQMSRTMTEDMPKFSDEDKVLLCFSRNGLISVKKVEALLDLNMGAVDILFGKSCLIQCEKEDQAGALLLNLNGIEGSLVESSMDGVLSCLSLSSRYAGRSLVDPTVKENLRNALKKLPAEARTCSTLVLLHEHSDAPTNLPDERFLSGKRSLNWIQKLIGPPCSKVLAEDSFLFALFPSPEAASEASKKCQPLFVGDHRLIPLRLAQLTQEHSSYLSDSNNQEKDVNREKSSVQEEVRAQHAIVKIGIERDPIVALKPSELKERPSSNLCQNSPEQEYGTKPDWNFGSRHFPDLRVTIATSDSKAPEELQSLPIASLEEEKRALDYAESISVELQSGTSHCVGKEIHHQSSLEKERTEGVERRDEASNTEPAVPTSSCKDDSHDPSEFKSLLAQLRDSEDKVKELQENLKNKDSLVSEMQRSFKESKRRDMEAFEKKSEQTKVEVAQVIGKLEERVRALKEELDAREEQKAQMEFLQQQRTNSETAMKEEMEKLQRRVHGLEDDESSRLKEMEDAAKVISNLEEGMRILKDELEAKETLEGKKTIGETEMNAEREKLLQRIKELEEEASKREDKEGRLRAESDSQTSALKSAKEEASKLHEENQKLMETLDLQIQESAKNHASKDEIIKKEWEKYVELKKKTEQLEESSKKEKEELGSALEEAKSKQRQIIEKNVAFLKTLKDECDKREKNLSAQVVTLSQEKKSLEEELQNNKESMSKEVELKKRELEEKSSVKVEALKKMADEQLSVIEDLKKRNSSLESANADQLKRLRRSDADHATAKDEAVKARSGLNALQTRLTTIEKQALQQEEIKSLHKRQFSDLKAEKEKLQNEVEDLKDKLKACQSQSLEQKEQIRNEQAEYVSNTSAERKQLQDQVKELSEQLETNQAKALEQEKASKQREEEIVQNANKEKESLQQQLNQVTEKLRLDGIKAQEQKDWIKKTEAEHLKSTVEKERLLKEVEKQLDAAEKRLSEQEKIRSKQAEQLSKSEVEEGRLQHQVSELNEKLKERNIKEREQEELLKKETLKLSFEKERLERQVKELTERLRANQVKEDEVKKLKVQLDENLQNETVVNDLKSQLKHQEGEITKLSEQIKENANQHEIEKKKLTEKLSKESEKNNQEKQKITAKMATVEQDNQDLKKRLSECEEKVTKRTADLEAQKSAHAAEEKLWQAQVSRLQDTVKKTEAEKESLMSDLAAAKERHKTLGQARITIANKLAEALKENQAFKREAETLRQEVERLKGAAVETEYAANFDTTGMRGVIDDLKAKNDSLEAALKERESASESLNLQSAAAKLNKLTCKVDLKQIDESILNKADIDLLKSSKPEGVSDSSEREELLGKVTALTEELNTLREQKEIFEKEAIENINKNAVLERKLQQETQLRKDVASELAKSKTPPPKGPSPQEVAKLKAELTASNTKIKDLTKFNNDQKQIIDTLEKKMDGELEVSKMEAKMLKEEKEVINSALSKAKQDLEKTKQSLEHLTEVELKVMEKQKTSLSAEATELKERCKSLEGDKDSLSKLNAKLEEEKQQLNHAMGTRSILDNSMEDKLANLEKLYKEEVRSKKRLETELMEYKIAKLEEEKNDLDAKIAIADSSTTMAEIKELEEKVKSLTKNLNTEKEALKTVTGERDKFKSRLDDLRAYRDKYDTEKKKRLELEKAVDSRVEEALKKTENEHSQSLNELNKKIVLQQEEMEMRQQVAQKKHEDEKIENERSLQNLQAQLIAQQNQARMEVEALRKDFEVQTANTKINPENLTAAVKKEFEAEKVALEKRAETLKLELQAAKERHKTLGQARITISKKLAEALDEVKVQKKKVEEQEEIVDVLKLEVKSMTLRLEGKRKGAPDDELFDRLGKMLENLDKMTKEKDQERDARKKKEDELSSAKQSLMEKTRLLENKSQELDSLKTQDQASSRSVQELEQLRTEVASLKAEKEKVTQERDATFKDLSDELEAYVKREEESENNVNKLKSENASSLEKVKEVEKEKEQLLEDAKKLQAEITGANASIESLCKEKADHLAAIEELKAVHKAKLTSLEEEKEARGQAALEMQQRLEDKKDKAEIDALREKINTLTRDNVNSKETIRRLEEDIGRTSKIREEEMARSNRLRSDIENLTTNLDKYKTKLDNFEAVEAKLKESERKLSHIKTELAEAETASEVKEKLVKDLREELKQVRQESSYGGDEVWQKKVDALEKKNKKLNRTIAMLTAKDEDSDDEEVPIKKAKLEDDLRLSESPTPTRSSDSAPSPATSKPCPTSSPSPSTMLPRRPSSTSSPSSSQLQSQFHPQQQSPARQTQVQTPPSLTLMPVQSQSQVQGRVSLPAGSPQQAQAANPQQFEMEMYEALVEALELAKTQKSAEELKGKYTELLNNLLTNTPYTREQIMPVLNRAFEHVVPGIIPAPVPTISLPNLTSSGAAMPPNRTILPANYQVPAHSLRLASPQVYQQRLRPPQPGQIQVQVVRTTNVQGTYMRHFTPRQPQPQQPRRRDT